MRAVVSRPLSHLPHQSPFTFCSVHFHSELFLIASPSSPASWLQPHPTLPPPSYCHMKLMRHCHSRLPFLASSHSGQSCTPLFNHTNMASSSTSFKPQQTPTALQGQVQISIFTGWSSYVFLALPQAPAATTLLTGLVCHFNVHHRSSPPLSPSLLFSPEDACSWAPFKCHCHMDSSSFPSRMRCPFFGFSTSLCMAPE